MRVSPSKVSTRLIIGLALLASIPWLSAQEVERGEVSLRGATSPAEASELSARPSAKNGLVQPPSRPLEAILANGRYNWSAAYQIQSMVYYLSITGEEKWARLIVDFADRLLEGRDALSPVDGRPYAWLDRSENLTAPYVWAGYTGHSFAPLMEFARYVLAHSEIGRSIYKERTFRDHALGYLREFNRALAVHYGELRNDGAYNYFFFSGPVPARSRRLEGLILPVNMNAALFLAILHAAKAEQTLGDGRAAVKKEQVERFFDYLNERVLERRVCLQGKSCLVWDYSSYTKRVEDVGHANLVAKLLLDGYVDGYGVRKADVVALANTVDGLLNPDGSLVGNLLDGATIKGTSPALYYLVFLADYSQSVRSKVGCVVGNSTNFAYSGPWRKIGGGEVVNSCVY